MVANLPGTCVAANVDHWTLEAVMDVRPSILCPVDFSDGSAGALRYAAAVASHFATRLIVLTVEDFADDAMLADMGIEVLRS